MHRKGLSKHNRRSICLLMLACLLSTSATQAENNEQSLKFFPLSYGYNLTESLLNPLQTNGSRERLRRQVARALYDVKMTGGQTVRWMATDIWRSYNNNTDDPEDQQTGELDPAWFEIVHVLMEQAQQSNVSVVVVLSDLARVGVSTESASGPGGFSGKSQYYGWRYEQGEGKVFDDQNLREHLKVRMVKMAKSLAQYPALGAIELYNEPSFKDATHNTRFWTSVNETRAAIQQADARLASIPIVSGNCWWDRGVVEAAQQTGALAKEPFITVHDYSDYGDERALNNSVKDLLTYVRKLVPGKPLVFAEAGSKNAVTDSGVHRFMVRTLLGLHTEQGVGVWPWGIWFSGPNETDYKWDFNHRSMVGDAFRTFFFADLERQYATPVKLTVLDMRSKQTKPVELAIQSITAHDSDAYIAGKWALSINGERFVGFSRAGVFSKPYAVPGNIGHIGHFGPPQPTFFISDRKEQKRWAEISYSSGSWSIKVFSVAATPGDGSIVTPDSLAGLAEEIKRSDFLGGGYSILEFEAKLPFTEP
ncbi:MAG: cellulase family glycosylhydrolase [Candidatus Obscuribacterales bacterium]|nr:cellulase family glycosylhydrolase [Candidatus Obscuribacterales bacterium]